MTPAATQRIPRQVVDLVALAVLGASSAVSFGPVFGGTTGYLAAGGGVALGLGIGWASAWRKWGVATTAAVVLVAYLLFVGPLALRDSVLFGFLPSLDTLQRGSLLFVQSWRDLLTVGLPAGAFSGPAVVPFLTGLVCTTIAARLALTARRYLWALAPMMVNLGVSILWGTRAAPLGVWVGALFFVASVVWAAWRQRRHLTEQAVGLDTPAASPGESQPSRTRRRWPIAALVLAGSLAASVAAAPALAGLNDRFVLRDVVQPPFDVRAFATPLMSYRDLEVNQESSKLFTATGLQKGDRIRLATLDSYDGIVYQVADSSAGFTRIGTSVDARTDQAQTITRTASYQIQNYLGAWVPGGGDLRTLTFTQAPKSVTNSIYYNSDTGTVVAANGLFEGNSYTASAVPPSQYSDDQLRTFGLASVQLPDTQLVPDSVGKVAAEYTDGAATGLDQLRALEKHLRGGFYSNGKDGKSASGHSAYRINLMLTSPQLVGDDEQYAVAMALMARQLGLPVRVVMGFYPDGGNYPAGAWQATGKQAHVWVEALFNQAGWVAFDPTPDRTRVPKTTVKQPPPKPKPRVQPPPIPPKEPVQPPTDLVGDKTNKSDPHKNGSVLRYVLWGAAGLGGLLLLASPVLVIAGLKLRRRNSRKAAPVTADSLAGGWAEVVDAAADLGIKVDHRLTRREAASVIADAAPAASPVALAGQIDAGVFGPQPPDAPAVDGVWTHVAATVKALRQQATRKRQIFWWVSTRSLRHPAPSSSPASSPQQSLWHRHLRRKP